MSRLPRYFAADVPQHVVQRGNDRREIFGDPADFGHFLALLRTAARRHGTAIHAYALMTNHVHLLATPSTPESLPKTMQWTFGRYVAYFNGRCGRTGTLLQSRYRATVVDDEHYLLTCMRYIELNPVRAGIASGPGEYAWSSFHANATGESDDLLTPHAVFRSLGGTRAERAATYLALFREVLAEADLDLIRDATHHGWAIGRSAFAERIAAASRRAHRLSSGRRPSQRGPST